MLNDIEEDKSYLKWSVDMCQYQLCSVRYNIETGKLCKVLGGTGCFYNNVASDDFDCRYCDDQIFICVR